MNTLLQHIVLQVNSKLYLKNPESSELGKRIVSSSIELLDESGFEHFTFRKLAQHINSTEPSVYRYFESKHNLLLYLINWYWAYLEYEIILSTANIQDPSERLRIAIRKVVERKKNQGPAGAYELEKLDRIIVAEASKSYLIKQVDEINTDVKAYAGYKQLVARISAIILELNPSFKYPHMLVSTVIEGAHHQRFFAEHLPRLTDIVPGEDAIEVFYTNLVFKTIDP